MKKLLFLFSLLCILVSCTDTETTENTEDYSLIHVNDSLPTFSVETSDGTVYSDLSLRGSVAVIVFFNTGCSDCRQELPQIESFYEKYRNNPQVKLIAISREENAEDIAAYWNSAGFSFPYSAQTDRTVYSWFASQNIPRIYITDPEGRVRFLFSDTNMPDESVLSDAVKSCLP